MIMNKKLLTTSNVKIQKGEKLGYQTAGIHFAPAKLSGYNVCKWASVGCTMSCLNTAGMGAFTSVQISRIEKTVFFFKHRAEFFRLLSKEIVASIKKASRRGLIPCFRPNLTSDLPWEDIRHEGRTIFEMFPLVTFYDYSKGSARMAKFLAGEMPANYHLTFSRSESNDREVEAVMASGGNVAVVFRGALPATWKGKPVISGDESDLRFLDPAGVVVGLVQKGKAKKDATGFVVSL